MFDPSLLDNRAFYGMNVALRQMTHFPKCLALPVWQQHGLYCSSKFGIADYPEAKRAGIMLVFSKRMQDLWNRNYDVPCFIGGLMLARYRRFMGWKQNPDARGTIFFAAHSVGKMIAKYDIEAIHQQLSMLPDGFQPVTISLHYYDCEVLHLDELYRAKGYEVFTAGPGGLSDYPQKFYRNLCRHKYACSNDVGTFILYSLEMDMPFFMIGDRPKVVVENGNSENLTPGVYDFTRTGLAKDVYDLFDTGPQKNISEEQKKWFREEAGMDEECDLMELRKMMMQPKYWIPAAIRFFGLHLKIGFARIAEGRWD